MMSGKKLLKSVTQISSVKRHQLQRKYHICSNCMLKFIPNVHIGIPKSLTSHSRNLGITSILNYKQRPKSPALLPQSITSPIWSHSDRNYCCTRRDGTTGESFRTPGPNVNWDFLCNPDNINTIRDNIRNRKGVGDIDKVLFLWQQYQTLVDAGEFDDFIQAKSSVKLHIADYLQNEEEDLLQLKRDLVTAATEIPNMTHPSAPIGDEDNSRVIATVGSRREFDFKPQSVIQLGEKLDTLRVAHLNTTTGDRSYYLKGAFAVLERALIKYTVDRLTAKGFKMVSVPDLIHPAVIEACGFKTTGERTQVYRLQRHLYGDVCLAGTGEMPLAGFFMDKHFSIDQLPVKVMTVSRCFRAETSTVEHERGLYRVHQFYKVEMFGVTGGESQPESQSEAGGELLMEHFVAIQTELFAELGLHFRSMDMASQELGAPAYRKFDMEAWMPAKGFWGEISSTSNCSDYQSRRLNIKYWDHNSELQPCHTVNGTACAVPRMLMALVENGQRQDGSITIPEALRPYMDGSDVITAPCKPFIARPIVVTKALKSRV